jgi:hypothetical protein
VSLGENNDKYVEVKDGLAEGERVALDAADRLAAESGRTRSDNSAPSKPEEPESPRSTPASSRAISVNAS